MIKESLMRNLKMLNNEIDNRVDQNLAGLDAKVKSIIKEIVKSHFIKKDAITFDASLLECDLTGQQGV